MFIISLILTISFALYCSEEPAAKRQKTKSSTISDTINKIRYEINPSRDNFPTDLENIIVGYLEKIEEYEIVSTIKGRNQIFRFAWSPDNSQIATTNGGPIECYDSQIGELIPEDLCDYDGKSIIESEIPEGFAYNLITHLPYMFSWDEYSKSSIPLAIEDIINQYSRILSVAISSKKSKIAILYEMDRTFGTPFHNPKTNLDIIDLNTFEKIIPTLQEREVQSVQWIEDSNVLVYNSSNQIKVLDLEIKKFIKQIDIKSCRRVPFFSCSKTKLAYAIANTITILDLNSLKVLDKIHSQSILRSIAWSPDGNYLAAIEDDKINVYGKTLG